jgi:outer membrane protein assembly factor BamB
MKLRIVVGVVIFCMSIVTSSAYGLPSAHAAGDYPTRGVIADGNRDWPIPGHDYDNSRDAGDSPIRASTVGKLRSAWTIATPGALTTAVVVVGNTVYAQDDRGVVVAVNKSTGQTLWQSASTGFTVGPEGVALGGGRVFAATTDGVEALDARSGQVIWTTRLTQTTTAGVDMQPTVIGNRVLIATVPVSVAVQYAGGDSGDLFAVDAATGKVDWSFDTVASKDLWGNPSVNSGGGAWYPPAIGTNTGIVYLGTANPGPFPGTAQYPNGSSRPGRNLYTDSTVALSLTTGRLIWYHQAVAHDLFDQDFVHAMLVTVNTGTGSHQIVVGAGKGGQVLGMNPSTGRLLWQTSVETSVGVQQNHSLTSLTGPTPVLPGTFGGVLTPPASSGGDVYVATLNAPTTLSPDKTAYFGGKIGTMPGEVVAIDAATGRHLWDTSIPGDPTGGATVVNNLVITATFQGALVVLDRRTGKILWTHQVGHAISGWLAIAGNLLLVPTGSVGSSGHLIAYQLPPS